MKSGYVVRPSASRDIDGIADYLTGEAGIDCGLRFLDELHATLSQLAASHEMGWHCKIRHPHLAGARTFRVSSRFSQYLIFYQPKLDRIEILRVLHGTQDLATLLGVEAIE